MSWNYSDLQTKIADFLHRTNLTSQIQDAITLFESECNTRLRHYMSNATQPSNITSGNTIDLPADLLALISFTYAQNGRPIRNVPLKDLDAADSSIVGPPELYAVDYPNQQIIVWPATDGSYNFTTRYVQGLGLSDANPTNWLLTRYPHIYLYGALNYMLEYITDIDRKNSVMGKHEGNMQYLEGANWDAIPLNDAVALPGGPIG